MTKKLLVLTSGGDAPGMNAALRSVVRSGIYSGFEVFGCSSGYYGLVDQDIFPLATRNVANIIQRGGTILKTDRCREFRQKEVRRHCIEFLNQQDINYIVVIGGDGSFRGASLLNQEGGLNVIGIPATIDNDVIGTEYTIGFNTAANTALNAIDKVRDTASSHDRHFLIEVMGRSSGFLAVEVGIAGGAELILTPEFPMPIEKVAQTFTDKTKRKKLSKIVIVAEADSQPGRSVRIAQQLRELTQTEFKVCILGHTQRGGSPMVTDRRIASEMGELAVSALNQGESNMMTAIQQGRLQLTEFSPSDNEGRRLESKEILNLSGILSL